MSKKKASGGATTMTLKDFHGGSIPSDLPLPSAPGVIVRPSDRPGFDRQGSWGNSIGRSDHRLRPGSAGAVRNFDDKAPFLGPSAHIGRNFDEDERKPLDGASGPRRTVSDDSIRALPTRTELKPDYSSAGRVPSRHISSPPSQLSGTSSYAGRVAEAPNVGGKAQNFGGTNTHSERSTGITNVGPNSLNLRGNSGHAAPGTHPNAWAIRKEMVNNIDPLPTTWSAQNASSKLAHASALEKVSSGRWQSKQPLHHPSDAEVIRHSARESELFSKGETLYGKSSYHPVDVAGDVEYHDEILVRHAERSLTVDDGIHGSASELPSYGRDRVRLFPESTDGKLRSSVEVVQPACNDGRFGGTGLQSRLPLEQLERPKLKLLPRSKPLEGLELPIDYNQGYQQSSNLDHMEIPIESSGNVNPTKLGFAGSDGWNLAVERPKLNLKPRSQPIEQSEENIERKRNTLFGGARPRELVLKERGVGGDVHNNDMIQPPNRVRQDAARTETVPAHANPICQNEHPETIPLDNRNRKNTDGWDNRIDLERTDMQKRNWRSENWRNSKETDRQQQPRERPPSPETWRKPVEQPDPATSDAPKLRYGKATSAVELAQAFSRSVSDPKPANQFPGQKGVPGRTQIPFSRLTNTNSRPQINGY